MSTSSRRMLLQARPAALAALLVTLAIGYGLGRGGFEPVAAVRAAGGAIDGPNVEAPDRYVYYPGTEVLAKDEIRVIACGTGMPDQRLAQASACLLMELGNGDKFIFDIGSGSMRNIAALMILTPLPYAKRISGTSPEQAVF